MWPPACEPLKSSWGRDFSSYHVCCHNVTVNTHTHTTTTRLIWPSATLHAARCSCGCCYWPASIKTSKVSWWYHGAGTRLTVRSVSFLFLVCLDKVKPTQGQGLGFFFVCLFYPWNKKENEQKQKITLRVQDFCNKVANDFTIWLLMASIFFRC